MRLLSIILLLFISHQGSAQNLATLQETNIDLFTVGDKGIALSFDSYAFNKSIAFTKVNKGKRKFPLGYGLLAAAVGIGGGTALILDANSQPDVDGLGGLGKGFQYIFGGLGYIVGGGGITTSLILGRK